MSPAASGILFDLDGTLIDTAPDFYRVLNIQREQYDLAPLPFPVVREAVSEGSRALVRLGFGMSGEEPEFEPRRQQFLDLYLEHICIDTALFPGYSDILAALDQAQIPWGIVTNKPRLYSEALLEAMGISGRVAVLVCPDDVTHTKPHPEPLLKAANAMGLAARELWYVGDHLRDIEAGRRAGMTTVAAAYGYIPEGDHAADWEADIIIQQPQDLYPLLFSEPA